MMIYGRLAILISLSPALVCAFLPSPIVLPERRGTRGISKYMSFDLFGKGEDKVIERPQRRGRKSRAVKRAMKKVLVKVLLPEDKTLNDSLDSERVTQTIFTKVDADGDGILPKTELADQGIQVQSLDSIDINGNGSIEIEEFQHALEVLEDRDSALDDLQDSLEKIAPLERQDFRLSGFEAYILVSVLSAQASFELVRNTDIDWDMIAMTSSFFDLFGDNWCKLFVLLAASGSTIAGLYATIVFSLIILYGNTALGLSRDNEYSSFLSATSIQRFRGCQAFSGCLSLFTVSAIFEICTRFPDEAHMPFVGIAGSLLYFFKKEYDFIFASASPIFSNQTTFEEKKR